MSKDLILKHRFARLLKQNRCPCCDDVQRGFACDTTLFPHVVAQEKVHHIMSPGDKASARYYCGSEFVIDERDEIVCRDQCPLAARRAADDMQEEADEAACEEDGAAEEAA